MRFLSDRKKYDIKMSPYEQVYFEQCQIKIVLIDLMITCVCVCVCVCSYSSTCWFLPASSGCTTSLTYLRSSDQRSFVVSILVSFCQVPSSLFLNLSYFTSKDENSSHRLLERKRYDIMFGTRRKDDIY